MIKCPECEEEFSYGRKICHLCADNSIFFGSIFQEVKKDYKWNSNTTIACYKLTTADLECIETHIHDISEKSEIEKEELNYYGWNCETEIRINNEIDKQVKNHILIFE